MSATQSPPEVSRTHQKTQTQIPYTASASAALLSVRPALGSLRVSYSREAARRQ